jgi:hypothetical protein
MNISVLGTSRAPADTRMVVDNLIRCVKELGSSIRQRIESHFQAATKQPEPLQ